MELSREDIQTLRKARNVLYGAPSLSDDSAADALRRADNLLFAHNPYANDHEYYLRRVREIRNR